MASRIAGRLLACAALAALSPSATNAETLAELYEKAKAEQRESRHVRRRTAMLDAIGGTPDMQSPRSKG